MNARDLIEKASTLPWHAKPSSGLEWAKLYPHELDGDDWLAQGIDDHDAALIVFAVNNLDRHLRIEEAAREFIGTMARRHSHIAGREVVSGFTLDSNDAAIRLDDVLAEKAAE